MVKRERLAIPKAAVRQKPTLVGFCVCWLQVFARNSERVTSRTRFESLRGQWTGFGCGSFFLSFAVPFVSFSFLCPQSATVRVVEREIRYLPTFYGLFAD
ncbi:hypothetical protein TNCV_2108141 [Trichonephila clavipes]|nr:hypothetical protein TNCV_2108141 [Trichonephila clavipes]